MVPTDAPGFERTLIPVEITGPEKQFALFLDDVRVPADAMVGQSVDAALAALFAGLNPERITGAAVASGVGRYALAKAAAYANTREVWGVPIGTHQGLSHPLAHAAIQVELARLMTAKAAWLYDAGDDSGGGRGGEHGEVRGGGGGAARAGPVDPDPRRQRDGHRVRPGHAVGGDPADPDRADQPGDDPQLFVATHTLGLPRSY